MSSFALYESSTKAAGSVRTVCSSLGAALAGAVGRTLYRVMQEFRARRAVRELQRLDDRTLRDIGLNRSLIEYAVRSNQAHALFDDERNMMDESGRV